MLRRLEKRILVDLPSAEAREAMYKHHLPTIVSAKETGGLELRADLDYHKLATVGNRCIPHCPYCATVPG